MSHDPYADFADDDEENALPSLSDCAPGLEEVFPPGPAKSSSYATGHMPMNALNTDRSVAYWSQEDDLEPRWTSRISKVPIAVSLVVVHAAHEDAGKGPADMKHIVVELLLTKDDEDKKVWVSPIMSVADATDSERLIVYCPAVLATKIAVVKRSPMLGLRTVQLFAVPLRRYKLSRTILTIDKFAVPQPFSLAELASSTAYSNLLTSSAGPALGNQESFVAEKEHEALSLVQHLSGIYDSETREFTHDAKTKPALFQYIISVMEQAKRLFASEPPLIDVRGPCYVFGDIHGNFGDLSYFMSNLIPFKHIRYCSHNFLFLGDYVDRGAYDVECLAYLCSLKIQAPDKIFLLRGNHEDRRQNASMSESFYNHCIKLFGSESGKELWARANDLFDMLPLCAVIENKIFCCHGGVPRVPKADSGVQMRIRDVLRKIPRPWSVCGDTDDPYQQAATDLLWADPGKDIDTFRPNRERGCSCVFGQKAIEDFLETNGFDFLIRAHQFFSFGVNISKGGKVITLFSSSNYCDHNSCAGCALLGTDNRIQLLMKEHPARQDQLLEDGAEEGS
ncbi:Minor serine/threonine-protein phosphatase PP2A-1 catalytic subunit [Diplonema papillatum]|nr:Minor serine/threonine-protein phosphatase PP2A-1 catalytic subunit [Diplonema papillatum]